MSSEELWREAWWRTLTWSHLEKFREAGWSLLEAPRVAAKLQALARLYGAALCVRVRVLRDTRRVDPETRDARTAPGQLPVCAVGLHRPKVAPDEQLAHVRKELEEHRSTKEWREFQPWYSAMEASCRKLYESYAVAQ